MLHVHDYVKRGSISVSESHRHSFIVNPVSTLSLNLRPIAHLQKTGPGPVGSGLLVDASSKRGSEGSKGGSMIVDTYNIYAEDPSQTKAIRIWIRLNMNAVQALLRYCIRKTMTLRMLRMI
jgi:hypothetical protein